MKVNCCFNPLSFSWSHTESNLKEVVGTPGCHLSLGHAALLSAFTPAQAPDLASLHLPLQQSRQADRRGEQGSMLEHPRGTELARLPGSQEQES